MPRRRHLSEASKEKIRRAALARNRKILRSPRNRKIARLYSQGYTTTRLAEWFDISVQRVNQLITVYRDRGLLPRPQKLVSLTQLVKKTGISRNTLARAARSAGIGERGYRLLRFTPDEIDRVVIAATQGACIECGAPVPTTRKLCSAACRQRRRTYLRNNMPELGGTFRSTGVAVLVADGLRRVKVGQYVSLREAARLAGLKRGQLTWLWLRGLIPAAAIGKRHQVTGKPIKLYSKNHAVKIGQLVQEARRKKGK